MPTAEKTPATLASRKQPAVKKTTGGASVLQYVKNFKALAGLGAILFVLYMMSNDIPVAWDAYQAAAQKVTDTEATRQKVLTKLEQLQNTSKNIKPLEVDLYKLNGAESPEIATLKVAQEVATLSRTTHNQYVSLTPQPVEKIDYSQVIDIPIKPDDVGTPPAAGGTPAAGAAPVGQPAGAANGVRPVDANGQPVAGAPTDANAAGKTLDPETTVSASKYVMVIKGNMRSLAEFIYQLTSFKTLIFIRKIHIGTGTPASASAPGVAGITTVGGSPTGGEAGGAPPEAGDEKGQITMELTFLVPWSN